MDVSLGKCYYIETLSDELYLKQWKLHILSNNNVLYVVAVTLIITCKRCFVVGCWVHSSWRVMSLFCLHL